MAEGLNGVLLLQFVLVCGFIIAFILGIAMARSRAGMVLAMMAVLVIAGLSVLALGHAGDGQGRRAWWSARRVVLGVLAFALVFAAQAGFAGILTRFERDPM
jgi:amino acid permease